MTVLGQDTAIRSDHSGGWGTATDGQTWSRIGVAPTLSLTSDELKLVAGATAGRSWQLLGSSTPSDCEILCRMEDISSTSDQMGLTLRLTDTANSMFAHVSGTTLSLVRRQTSTNTVVSTATVTFSLSTFYWMRFKAVASTYWVRFWADGTAEPKTWDINAATDSTFSSGQFGCYANTAATNNTIQYDSFLTVDYANLDQLSASDSTLSTETFVPSESVSVTDSVADALSFVPSESVAASESILSALAASATSSVTGTESLLDALALVSSESVSASESVLLALAESMTESATLAESVLLGGQSLSTDSVTVLETLAQALAYIPVDTGTLSDTASVFALVEAYTDTTLSIIDSLVSVSSASLTATDTVTVSDVVAYALAFVPSESVTLSEILLGAATFSIAESVVSSDSMADALSFVPSESVTLVESVLSALSKSTTESVTAAENVLSTPTFSSSESVAGADSAAESLSFAPIESVTTAESVLYASAESVIENLSLAESVLYAGAQAASDALTSVEVLLGAATSALTDVLSLSDTLLLAALLTGLDQTTITDALVSVSAAGMSGVDTATVLETIASQLFFVPADQVTLSEVIQAFGGAMPSTVFPTILGSDSAIRANHFGGWGIATDGQTWSRQGVAPTLSLVSNELNLVAATNTGRTWMTLGAVLPSDQEVLCRMQAQTSTNDSIGLTLRFAGSNNTMFAAASGTTLSLVLRQSGTSTTLATASITFALSTWYWMRARAVGNTYWVRWWADGTAEPHTWTIDTITDTTFTSGGFGCFATTVTTGDTILYDSFIAVSYANADAATPVDASLLALAYTAPVDTATITDSLPNYFPADVVTAIELLLDALSTTYSDSGDALSATEIDLTTTAISANDGSLLPDDSLSDFFPSITFVADTSLAVEAPTLVIGPLSIDTLVETESVSYALVEALSDTAPPLSDSIIPGNLFPFTDSLTGIESLALSLSEGIADGGTLLSDSLIHGIGFTFPVDTAPPTTDLVSETVTFAPVESVAGTESLAQAFAIALAESSVTGDILAVSLIETAPVDGTQVGVETFFGSAFFVPVENLAESESIALAFSCTFTAESAVAGDLFSTAYTLTFSESAVVADVFLAACISFATDTLAPLQELGSLSFALSVTESGQVADATAVASAYTAPIELGVLAENILLALADTASDSGDALTSSDSLVASVTSSNLAFSEVNQLTVLDQLALLFQFSWGETALAPLESVLIGVSAASTENVTGAETASVAFVVAFAQDTLSSSDTISLFVLSSLPSSDTVSGSETGITGVVFIPIEVGTPSESVLQSLLSTVVPDLLQALDILLSALLPLSADVLSATEVLTEQAAYLSADAPTLTESVLLSLAQNATEGVVASDTVLSTLLASTQDAVSVLELLSAGNTLLRSDTGVPVDAGVIAFTLLPLDNLTLSDALTEAVAFSTADSALTPLEAAQIGIAQAISDVVAGQESVLSALSEQLSDLVSINDSLTFAVGVTVALAADVVGAIEQVSLASQLSVFDVLSVVDSSSVAVDTNVFLFTESIAATEQLLATLVVTQSDTVLTITDSILAFSALYLSAIAVVRSGLSRAILRTGTQNAAVRSGTAQTHIR